MSVRQQATNLEITHQGPWAESPKETRRNDNRRNDEEQSPVITDSEHYVSETASD